MLKSLDPHTLSCSNHLQILLFINWKYSYLVKITLDNWRENRYTYDELENTPKFIENTPKVKLI